MIAVCADRAAGKTAPALDHKTVRQLCDRCAERPEQRRRRLQTVRFLEAKTCRILDHGRAHGPGGSHSQRRDEIRDLRRVDAEAAQRAVPDKNAVLMRLDLCAEAPQKREYGAVTLRRVCAQPAHVDATRGKSARTEKECCA